MLDFKINEMTVVGNKVVKAESFHLENNQIKYSKWSFLLYTNDCTELLRICEKFVPSLTFFITKSFGKNCDFA